MERSFGPELAVFLLLGQAGVSVAQSPAELGLETPAFLRLGEDGAGEVRLAPDPSVLLFASMGEFEPLASKTGEPRLARWVPPKGKAPRAAIIAAVSADGTRYAWRVVPLHGRAKLNLKASRRSTLEVRIGGERHGPIKTDRAGRATVSVWAAPSVRTYMTVATDAIGNVSTLRHTLNVPPFNRLLLVCPAQGTTLLAFVVDERGEPQRNARLELQSNLGTLSEVRLLEPGVYAADLGIPHTARVGDRAKLSGRLAKDEKSHSTCSLRIPKESPSGIVVSLSPERYGAGAPPEVQVIVTLQYPGERPPLEVTPTVAVDRGSVDPPTESEPGIFHATWHVPQKLEGNYQAKVQAQLQRPDLTASALLALEPGPPARIEFEAAPPQLVADGYSTTSLTARVFDAHDNPVTAVLEAPSGASIAPFEETQTGVFLSSYTAPKRYVQSVEVLSVHTTAGEVSGETSVTLRAHRAPRFVEVRGGWMANFGKVSSPVLAVAVHQRLPLLSRRVGVGLEVRLATSKREVEVIGGDAPVSFSLLQIPVLARAQYEHFVGALSVYGGIALGVAMVRAEVTSKSTGRVVRWHTPPAGFAVIGARRRLGPGRVLGELGYGLAPLQDDPVEGNTSGLTITAGYALEF